MARPQPLKPGGAVMASSEELASGLAVAAEIGRQQEADAANYHTEHNWWLQWSGRVDEWHAFAKEWDDGDPVGYSRVSAADAIADLKEQIADDHAPLDVSELRGLA